MDTAKFKAHWMYDVHGYEEAIKRAKAMLDTSFQSSNNNKETYWEKVVNRIEEIHHYHT